MYKQDADVLRVHAVISDVVRYTFIPPNANNDRVMICCHGGSYALGGIESHSAMLSHLSMLTRTKIIFVEYRLAAKNTFPKDVHDFFRV